MVVIKDKRECSGCAACSNICPVSAITMVEDSEGFKYPKIDKEKCIKCGLCNKICPIANNYTSDNYSNPEVYAAYSLDDTNRKQSSSGGIFTELAKLVLQDNGVVFGAGYDNTMNVISKYIEDENDLIKLKGSKYVQSDMLDSYNKIKAFLQQDRKVLFVGTPCQVAGLYSFLQKEKAHKNLYTIDLVCHGVPSPKVYRQYKEAIERKYKDKINDINFRDKTKGWNNFSLKMEFSNGRKYRSLATKDLYIKGFLHNIYLRPSCYECKFGKLPRISDISLGDFWGVENKYKEFCDNKGTSLILVNNQKGKDLIKLIENNIDLKKNCDLEYAIKMNPCITTSVREPSVRKDFFEDFEKQNFISISNKYIPKEKLKDRAYVILVKLKRKIYNVLKK